MTASDKVFLRKVINKVNFYRYKKMNTLVINEGELRYELRDKHSNILNLVKNLSKKISVKNIVVTRGIRGATLVNCKDNSIISCPAFNQNNIDTMGAGDTFFGMCSLSIGSKIDNKIGVLMASLSASFAIGQLGKKSFFNNNMLKKHLTHIFK